MSPWDSSANASRNRSSALSGFAASTARDSSIARTRVSASFGDMGSAGFTSEAVTWVGDEGMAVGVFTGLHVPPARRSHRAPPRTTERRRSIAETVECLIEGLMSSYIMTRRLSGEGGYGTRVEARPDGPINPVSMTNSSVSLARIVSHRLLRCFTTASAGWKKRSNPFAAVGRIGYRRS
jgi:hypothetical protein